MNERIHENWTTKAHPARNDKMSEMRLPDSSLRGHWFLSLSHPCITRRASADIVSSDPTGALPRPLCPIDPPENRMTYMRGSRAALAR